MQTATLDPLDDVATLLEMALAAEARLRPHLVNPPADLADDIPHLNRVTLILGRLIAIRKSIRALRDGHPTPPRPAGRPSGRSFAATDKNRFPKIAVDSVAADLAAAGAMIDRLPAVDLAASAKETVSLGHEPPPENPAADSRPAPPAPTVPIAVSPGPIPTGLAIPLVSPAQSEANAKKFARALAPLAAEARRIIPNAIPSSPFGIDDLYPPIGPLKLSQALHRNIRPRAISNDTS